MAKSLGDCGIEKKKKEGVKKLMKFNSFSKKAISFFLCVMMVIFSVVSVSANDETYVYVSIANGELVLSYEKIAVTDIDEDGEITINDALFLAHEAKFEGGASAGYASSMGEFGLKIDMLWGINNNDSYGYYVNNTSAMSLGDKVKNGDHVYAFLYKDLTSWSDTYSYFNVCSSNIKSNEKLDIVLSYSGYDENWNMISLPAENATVTVNGKATEIKTDKDGKFAISFDKEGIYVLSANSESQNLVPAVCVVEVTGVSSGETEPAKPGDTSLVLYYLLAGIALFTLIVFKMNGRKYAK